MSVELPSMNIERIREALADPALFDEGASVDDTLRACERWHAANSPEAIRELLAENDRLRAAVQHEADCVEAAKAEVEALRAERDALLDALQHMRHCGWCAADDWQNCEGGRAALAAIDAAKGRA